MARGVAAARGLWAGLALGAWAAGVAGEQGAALPAVPWQPGPAKYSVAVPGSRRPTLSLYPPGGAVGVATGKSLRDCLVDPRDGGRHWYFLELYDHMCPHCWYAVPVVNDVAEAYAGSQGLRVASLNCHMRDNAEACFFLEIISGAMDYPTFLLCPPKIVERPTTIDHETIRKLPQRAQGLLQHLTGEQRRTFLDLLRCRTRYVEPHAKAGKEDPFLSAEDVAVWVNVKTGQEVLHSDRLTKGADFTDPVNINYMSAPGRPGWLRDDKDGSPGVPAWVPGQRWFDSLRGFVALLHQGYRESRHQAAVDSAWFLAHTFPVKGRELGDLAKKLGEKGPMPDPGVFRKFLASWARSAGIPDPLEGLAVVTERSSEEEKYTTCEGSSCVMWTLLHVTLTAVAARGISGRTLLGDESLAVDGKVVNLAGVDEAVRFVKTFVEAFLSCRQCKVNFLKDFEACEYGRCTISDFRALPLWLWRMHNAVSLRVAQHHKAKVDRRWPMYEDCPTCWRKELVMAGEVDGRRLLSAEGWDAPFHPDRVFWHLVRTYIGVQRVAFELSDLNRGEREEVEAVLERERAVASGEPLPQPGGPHGQRMPSRGHPRPPPPPPPPPQHIGTVGPAANILIHLTIGFTFLGAVFSAVLCYHGCDIQKVVQMLGVNETRTPVLREGGLPSGGEGERDDDDEDVGETGRGKADSELAAE